MAPNNRWSAVVLGLAAVGVSACANSSAFDDAAATDEGPAKVEAVKGSDAARVILSAQAARRLGVQTAPVRRDGTTPRHVIPYAAVLYDAQGRAFAYTSPARLTYVREPISIDAIRGKIAVLNRGPRTGMPVVTVGAAELLGTEYGVEEG
jgi:hypothetical protein